MLRAFCFFLVLFVVTPAHAFTVASAFSVGCHEEITEAALRSTRATLTTADVITPTADERAFVADLPFDVPGDMTDLAAASLLVGVRDNDLKGRSPTEIDENAMVTGDPNHQEEHCLRTFGDEEPTGSARAIERCQTFIEERAMAAVLALDPTGHPDPNLRDSIAVNLSVRGDVTASLPAFWVRIGESMHALQDSFAHAYRTADGMHPTVVLDWVDLVDKDLVESRNGPPHKFDLDECDANDALRARNKTLATQASRALLEAVLDPTLSVAQKSDAVHAVVVEYTSYSPGCTFANAWCDAPETRTREPTSAAAPFPARAPPPASASRSSRSRRSRSRAKRRGDGSRAPRRPSRS